MTCFWDAIQGTLSDGDYTLLGLQRRPNHQLFINTLKEKNVKPKDVLWNGKLLIDLEQKEHFQAIAEYDIKRIGVGHWTGACDSFLLLLCQLLNVEIIHKYMNTNIIYKKRGSKKVFKFRSSGSHFMKG